MKICAKCRVEKPLSEFGKRTKAKDGLQHDCKECRNAYNRAYNVTNRDRFRDNRRNADVLERKRKYDSTRYVENSDEIKLRTAAWLKSHPEWRKLRNAQWAKNNPDKVVISNAQYYAANSERIRARNNTWWYSADKNILQNYRRNRRARIHASGGTLSSDIVDKLLAQQEGCCVYCNVDLTVTTIHLDHRMPIKLGGTNTDDNVQLLCASCNLRKGSKHPDDFERQIGYTALRQ
jgi:5-methylcytosine-specific restriction endonuclease McrA